MTSGFLPEEVIRGEYSGFVIVGSGDNTNATIYREKVKKIKEYSDYIYIYFNDGHLAIMNKNLILSICVTF